MSLPPRERGLKRAVLGRKVIRDDVAPPAGAWIETSSRCRLLPWASSLPPRERGLKLDVGHEGDFGVRVAPPAGAWIETETRRSTFEDAKRRSPRGSVD